MNKIFFFVLLLSFQVHAGLTLTMGGDVNFNKNLMKADPKGFLSENGPIPWSSYTKYLAQMLDGDLNFANIETVVSDRSDLIPQQKTYVFQTHTNALSHLIDIGFNLMNIANNHAYDFGDEGIAETMKNTAQFAKDNSQIQFSGLGYKKDLLQPVVFKKNGYTIAIASLSIVDSQFVATDEKPGLLNIRNQDQYRQLVKNMKATAAHYKILSIHMGTEKQVQLDSGQKSYYEYAIKNGDVDLIIGHHPHAVRSIEKMGDKYIFYSLGNYLMLGSANITGLTDGLDFGLFAKLHLVENQQGRLIPEAIEMTPLTQTHAAVRPLPTNSAIQHMMGLQALSNNQLGADSLLFQVTSKGKGLFCKPDLILESSQKACAEQ